MPLLSDSDLGLAPAPKQLLSDEELLGPRAPLYLGAGGKPLTDDEYAALRARGPQPSEMSPLGRIGEASGGAYMNALQPDVPLGLSPGNFGKVSSYVGPTAAGAINAPLSIADFALRGIAAPFHAAASGLGQTANELGLSQGQGDTGPARDILGLLDVAGLMTAPFAGVSTPRASVAPRPTANVSEVATRPQGLLQSKLDALAPKPAATVAEDVGVAATATPDFAGNINLNRIQAPEDVKNVIRETAAANENFVGARRGKMTFDDIRELAPLVGMTPEKLAKRGLGQTFNAEEMFAARQLLVAQADEVKRLAQVARGGSDADKFEAMQSITRLVAIQEQVSGATAEGARMLSQQRMMAGASRDAENIKRLLEGAGGRLDDILEGVAKLDDPAAVASFVKKGMAARTSDMLLEAWINALLSGPTTHATNILSNSLVSLWSIPETAVAAGISKVTGSGIRGSEVLGRAFGLIEGAKDGIRAGWRTFRSEEPSDLTSKIEAAKYRAIPSVKIGKAEIGGKQVRIPGRLLMAEDEFFKSIGYRQEINAQAFRLAANQGLKGKQFSARVAELKANPTDEMAKAARDAAEKQTFTNPLGKFGQQLMAMTREVPALRIVMPFIRTPVNIVKFAAERSPFAPLFKDVRANLAGKNGAVARDTQIARIALGSTVSAATAYMALEGAITGGGPADPKARAVQYETRWQPYSVKIGDQYFSYGRLEPLGMMLGVAADFTELANVMSEEEQKNVAALIMGSVQKNLVSKTWLRGLSEMIEAFQDPERYGEQYVQNLAGTLVPTAIAQAARTCDPYLREARSILDKIKERVPGLRETLPVRRGILGNAIKLEGSLGPDILSPIYTSTASNDPVAREMARLRMAPSKPSRKVMGVDLTPQEYDAYQQSTGQLVRHLLNQVVATPEYQRLPDDQKKDVIDDVFRKSRDIARGLTIQQSPDFAQRMTQKDQK